MQKQKIILIIALVALASLMIGPASAVVNYSYWDDHRIYYAPNATALTVSGAPLYGVEHVYTDTPRQTPTFSQMITQAGYGGGIRTRGVLIPQGGSTGTFMLDSDGWHPTYFTNVFYNLIDGTNYDTTMTVPQKDGYAFQTVIALTYDDNSYIPVGPLYVIHQTEAMPIISDFTYAPAEPWIAPANVTFTSVDSGKKADAWYWSVHGTGFDVVAAGYSSINVTLPYPGTYDVELTVVNGTQEDSETKSFTVLNEAGSYSLIMSPDTGTTATNFTAAITAGVEELGATLSQFTISCAVNGVVSYCTTGGKDPIFIKQDDGNWYLDGVLYSASFPSSVPLKFNVPGIHTVVGWFFTTDPTDMGTEVSDTVTVTSTPGEVKLSVEVRDSSDNALIGGSDILLKKEDGTWDNQTVGSGFRDYYVPGGNNIGIGATAAGYIDSVIEYNRFYEDAKKIVLLNRISTGVPEGNNTLSVYVRKGGIPDVVGLDGATVKLNDGQTKLTPASGLAQFLVLDDETYFITVSKYGYLTTSKYFSVSGAVNAVTIELYTPGFTTTATLAPGETTVPGTPITTYPPGVPMPGTTITYPPGVPVIGAAGDSTAANGTARDIAVRNLDSWMIWGGTILFAIIVVMFIGFSGDALKKWSWLWK